MSIDTTEDDFVVCTPKFLPADKIAEADKVAIAENPENAPDDGPGAPVGPGERLVVDRRVYWGKKGVRLTVGFPFDNPPADLRARILSHMNAWSKTANVQFVETDTDPQVRIARTKNDGYWSYLGTDILTIPKSLPTMNLDSFTMNTRDSEFFRVVRHETGHTLGFPHEHMRKEIITRLDEAKVIEEFMRTQGWSEKEVRAQVLTALEKSSILGSETADVVSIMCYQIPGRLTKDGKAIPGGLDIDPTDYAIAANLYPKPETSA